MYKSLKLLYFRVNDLFVSAFNLYTLMTREKRENMSFFIALGSWMRKQFYVIPYNFLLSYSKFS